MPMNTIINVNDIDSPLIHPCMLVLLHAFMMYAFCVHFFIYVVVVLVRVVFKFTQNV